MKNLLTLAISVFLFGTVTMAQTMNTHIDERQKVQRMRMAQGKHNGSLNKQEMHMLRRQQQHIRKAECRVEADGVVTPAEKRLMNHKQNKANHFIRRARHNSLDRKV